MDLIAARVQYERGDIVAARDHMDRGAYALPSHCLVETDILAWEARIGLKEASSGIDAALADLREWTSPARRQQAACTCMIVGLLLRAGRTAEAQQYWDSRIQIGPDGLPTGDDAGLPPDMMLRLCMTRAWLQFASGQQEDAARLASRFLPLAEQHGRQPLRVKLLLLKAALHLAASDRVRARGPFRLALETAAHNDLFATVHEQAWALLPLLSAEEAPAALGATVLDFMIRLRHRLGLPHSPVAAAGGGNRPLEELTGRETEILRALESGLSTQAVADRMSVSLATVKWHIQNIYSKLGVNNRTGALATARRLCLL
jgi:LuxR family maltose regulon positive regulatory protein